MSGFKAIIAEDEANLREELRDTLGVVWPELAIVAEAEDGDAALRALDEHAPQVMFLDIQMPGADGLEIARRAGSRAHVVFVTAYDKYAIAAFEAGAIDYVLKPITASRLEQTVRRLKARVREAPADLASLLHLLETHLAPKREYMRYITAVQSGEIRLITVDEICYFQADNKYTRVVSADGESLIRRGIGDLLHAVDPARFWQIHRSTIVNIDAVSGVSRDFRGYLRVKLKARKETLAVSERFAHRFRQM
ncbi:MAG TPA: LytTR family DNA-binding domain-containing protein [Casimicrobiaceae bacterium]|nr:LytTR family DNA-binding domain-containing protein [Casimicrobiaceae bacterium]